MNKNTTVVIPIGPGHDDLSYHAIDSVETQTIKAALAVVWDQRGKGAGWARNQGLEQVRTPYVLFLDADDWLEPNAIELFEAAIEPDRYVYSDWFQDGKVKQAAACAFCITEEHGLQRAHVITALLPTEWAREIGGFDEDFPVMEDTDFWVKLRYVGKREGKRIATPLMHYGLEGWRSKFAVERAENGEPFFTELCLNLRKEILARYKDEQESTMSCCGQPGEVSDAPMNAKIQGDMLVRVLGGGNRRFMGLSTGRMYRGGNGLKLWIAPSDVEMSPSKFKVVRK